MDHGESCLITIGIWNEGSADASQITAVLNSFDPGVEIDADVAAIAGEPVRSREATTRSSRRRATAGGAGAPPCSAAS